MTPASSASNPAERVTLERLSAPLPCFDRPRRRFPLLGAAFPLLGPAFPSLAASCAPFRRRLPPPIAPSPPRPGRLPIPSSPLSTAAARWLKGPTIRRECPKLIHNVWIRLENRSKVIERTCLVEWDRPYSPSLDGASHGAVDGRPRGILSSSDGPRKETPGTLRAGRRFSFQSEYRTKRKSKASGKKLWTTQRTGTRYRDPPQGSPAPLGP